MELPTSEAIAVKVREIATELPEYTYDDADSNVGCVYRITDNNPHGCVVGAGLSRLGVMQDTLRVLDVKGSWDGVATWLAVQDADRVPNVFDDWLTAVQDQQDHGKAWGEALVYADKMLPLTGELTRRARKTRLPR